MSEKLKDAISNKEELDAVARLSAKFLSALTELSDSTKVTVANCKETTSRQRQKIVNKEAEIEDLNRQLETIAMGFEALDLENNDALQHYKKAEIALREIAAPQQMRWRPFSARKQQPRCRMSKSAPGLFLTLLQSPSRWAKLPN